MARISLLYSLILLMTLPVAAGVSTVKDKSSHPWLLVTNAAADTVSYVDPDVGVIEKLEVGKAPFGIAVDDNGLAYVATAEGVAIVDIASRTRRALIPYRADTGAPGFGEYRAGGMGIDVSVDGRFIYVGVNLGGEINRLEVIDSLKGQVVASYPIGKRPFDVLLSDDERQVYSIDHDSYSVTAVSLSSEMTRTHEIAPLGYGAFDKPHYAASDRTGSLWLPVQGRVLVRLDPSSGKQQRFPLSAKTHQHGIAISRDGQKLVVVGTGAAGSARKGPSLTVYELETHTETIVSLQRTHEAIVLSQDGRFAYLTGGQSFTGGWDGLSVVDLETGMSRYLQVPDQPLGIVAIPAQVRRN